MSDMDDDAKKHHKHQGLHGHPMHDTNHDKFLVLYNNPPIRGPGGSGPLHRPGGSGPLSQPSAPSSAPSAPSGPAPSAPPVGP